MPPTLANGKICYLELPSTDPKVSAAFYGNVFGWAMRTRGDGAVAFRGTPDHAFSPLSEFAQFLHFGMAVRRIVRQGKAGRIEEPYFAAHGFEQAGRFLRQQPAE